MRLIYLLAVFFLPTLVYAQGFVLDTHSFQDGNTLAPVYTCDGKDISPDFTWRNAPLSTKSFAFIVSDPDAPNGDFYHWVLYNIPSNINTLEQGFQPSTPILVGRNDFGRSAYNGACPSPNANKPHRYFFTIYALDTELFFPPGTDARTIMNALRDHTKGKAEVMATYSRPSS